MGNSESSSSSSSSSVSTVNTAAANASSSSLPASGAGTYLGWTAYKYQLPRICKLTLFELIRQLNLRMFNFLNFIDNW